MFRTLDMLLILALIAGAAWTFKIKGDSEEALERASILERKIGLEKEAIDLLRADWSLLTSPQRLEKLFSRYGGELKLEPVDPGHIGSIAEIPLRAETLRAIDAEEAERDAGLPPDAEIKTGSVKKPVAKSDAKPGAKPSAKTGAKSGVDE